MGYEVSAQQAADYIFGGSGGGGWTSGSGYDFTNSDPAPVSSSADFFGTISGVLRGAGNLATEGLQIFNTFRGAGAVAGRPETVAAADTSPQASDTRGRPDDGFGKYGGALLVGGALLAALLVVVALKK